LLFSKEINIKEALNSFAPGTAERNNMALGGNQED
jgi:hypothetical protein